MEDNRDFYIDGEQVSETQFYDQLHHSVEETANQMTYLPQFDEEIYLEFMQLVTQVDTYGILEWRNHTYERRGEIIYIPIERFNNFVEEMQSVSGRIDKENILTKYINDVELKEILNFIFNPYIITGISSKKINKFKNYFDPLYNDVPDSYRDVMSMLEYLKEHNHGRDEDLIEVEQYATMNSPYENLIYAIATKDLKLGVQPTTLNKVYGKGFIPTFDVMLAQKYFDDPDKLVPDGTEFILTTKLDGVRCVLINEENNPKFFSRQGQMFEGLVELEKEARLLPTGFVYDGELLLNKDGLESKDLYRETMKVVSADKEKLNVNFNIFDMLPIEDFKNGYCDKPAKKRKLDIMNLFDREDLSLNYMKEVKVLYFGENKDAINNLLDDITKKGGEGVMINLAESPYECKRSKGLLKVKKMQTADVRVIGIEEGTGKNKGKVGALKIEFIGPDGNIYQNDVGSGLTDELREDFWNNQDKVLNKIIEIKYFEISSNQNGTYGLRFPVFKWIREDKDEISMY